MISISSILDILWISDRLWNPRLSYIQMTYLTTQEPWAYMDNYWDYGISTCIS